MKPICYSLLFFTFLGFSCTAQSTGRQFVITLQEVAIVSNNSVGDDWEFRLQIDDRQLGIGQSMSLQWTNRAPLSILAQAIENDPQYNDFGSASLELTYSNLIAIQKNNFEIKVTVAENAGNYAGNLAVLKFSLTIEQVRGDTE